MNIRHRAEVRQLKVTYKFQILMQEWSFQQQIYKIIEQKYYKKNILCAGIIMGLQKLDALL